MSNIITDQHHQGLHALHKRTEASYLNLFPQASEASSRV